MKLKNLEIDALYNALKDIANGEAVFSAEAGFKILDNISLLQRPEQVYGDAVKRTIQKYSSDGKVSKDKNPDAFKKCKEELDELKLIESEVDIRMLEAAETAEAKLPMKQMFALKMITKEEEENGKNCAA